MKHSIVVKFLVILLASLSILTVVACGAGIYAMESADLYANGIHSLQDQQYDSLARSIANMGPGPCERKPKEEETV